MSEFRIETSLELDTKKALREYESFRKKVGKTINANLNLNEDGSSKRTKTPFEKSASKQLSQYKKFLSEYQKLANIISKGNLKGNDLEQSKGRLKGLKNELDSLKGSLEKIGNVDLRLINESAMTKSLSGLDAISKKVNSLKDKKVKLNIDLFGEEKIAKLTSDLNRINGVASIKASKGLTLDDEINQLRDMSKEFDNMSKQQASFDKLTKGLTKLKGDMSNFKLLNPKEIDSYSTKLNTLEKNAIKNIRNNKDISKQFNGLNQIGQEFKGLSKVESGFAKLRENAKKLSDQVIELKVDVIGEEKINELLSKIKQAERDAFSNIRHADTDKKASALRQSVNNMKNIGGEVKGYHKAQTQFESLSKKIQALDNQAIKLNVDLIGEEQVDRLRADLRELKNSAHINVQMGNSIGEQINQLDTYKTKLKNMKDLASIRGSYNEIIDSSSYKGRFKEIDSSLASIGKRINRTTDLAGQGKIGHQLESLSTHVNSFGSRVDRASNKGRRFGGMMNEFHQAIAQISIGNVLGDVMYQGLYGVRRGYAEIDKSMANLKKVANPADIATKSQLEGIRKEAVQISKDVGEATYDVQNAIASSLQAGVGGMKDSIAVARDSMILANVGDMTQEDASSSLNSIIAGFKLNPLKEVSIEMGNTTQKTTELANAMDLLNYAG